MPRPTSAAALVRKGYIKGIIGLPANLFYGTGIPACIVVVDKQDAHARKGIFMIDASQGFMKDGPKNRLRAQDIHKIVDVFTRRLEVPRLLPHGRRSRRSRRTTSTSTCRATSTASRPRTCRTSRAICKAAFPCAMSMRWSRYWAVCPKLRKALFKPNRPGYVDLAVEKTAIKPTIYEHPEFTAFITGMNAHFAAWRKKSAKTLKALASRLPSQAGDCRAGRRACWQHYTDKPLIDPYDIYQHLMDYWAETMQDDCYLIAADGWKAETYRIIETKKSKDGKRQGDGQGLDLRPGSQSRCCRPLLCQRAGGDRPVGGRAGKRRQPSWPSWKRSRSATKTRFAEARTEAEEGKEGKVTRATVTARLKQIKGDKDAKEEAAVLHDGSSSMTSRANQEEAEGGRGCARFRLPRAIPEAHRGRNQDVGGG